MRRLLFSGVAALVLGVFAGCGKPTPLSMPGVRVVSLAPSLTEMVCAVGGMDTLVGRTSACDYPPEVSAIKVIGGFGAPSMELLTAASPTVVIEIDLDDQTVGRKIRNAGLRLEHVTCRRLDDIPTAIETVGTLIDRREQALALADDLKQKIAALRVRAGSETNRPSVYVEIWHDPLMTAGTNAFLSELVYLAGGRNIGDDVAKDYFQVSPEWVVAKDPDIILCLYLSKQGSAKAAVMNRNGWASVKAVHRGTVYDGLNNDLILRPGPRVLQSIESLRPCVQGSSFP